jgi:hypothetical protein
MRVADVNAKPVLANPENVRSRQTKGSTHAVRVGLITTTPPLRRKDSVFRPRWCLLERHLGGNCSTSTRR